jgi:iron(II)-dependent oxidoreductase
MSMSGDTSSPPLSPEQAVGLLSEPLSLEAVVGLLEEARARTRSLIAPLSPDDLRVQHDSIMSPIVWDLGHIGHFEDVWLNEKIDTGSDGSEGLRGTYNPFEHPRSTRAALPLPDLAGVERYWSEVRARVKERLATLSGEPRTRLLREGFVFRMVLQHEYQHNETILQTLQLKTGAPYPAPREPAPRPSPSWPDLDGAMVRFPGGEVVVGTDDRSSAYDNERPAHVKTLAPFEIDVVPVTNRAYLGFVDGGGYDDRSLWTDAGWAWREESGARAPAYWKRRGSEWWVRSFDRDAPVDPSLPVQHVSFHEAQAFARSVGKRLPDEFEWEAAASWDPSTRRGRWYPWGDDAPTVSRANLDAKLFQPAPVGAYPLGASPIGCLGMIGDVWEWTSSDFRGYPGFRMFPYPPYARPSAIGTIR